jgi:membrane protease YdiL (CAAX protease family)
VTTLEHVANAPLTLGLIALASERVRKLASRSLPAASLVVPVCWLVQALGTGRFGVLPLALVLLVSVGTVVALSAVSKGDPRLTVRDFVVGLVLFLPLDLRWTNQIGGGYAFWALALSYLSVLGWGCAPRELPGFGYRRPTLRDAGVGLLTMLAFAAIAIPLGFKTGFLKRAPSLERFEVKQAALSAFGYVFTVALPEEILFRGVLDRGLQATLRSPIGALVVSSLLFGFMHWPRRNDLKGQLTYSLMAAVAGCFYAVAFRKGNGLPAAVICHASIDWVWEQLWKR